MEEAGISPNQLNLVGNFEAQVQHIMERVRLTKMEVDRLNLLYSNLGRALQAIWPGCRVIPFGSIVTGLGIKTSDVDCFVDLPIGMCDISSPSDIVIQARNILRKQYHTFQKTFAITTAKVPIVKFYHAPTGYQCDVNFKSLSGVRNTKLLELLLNFDNRSLVLAVVVKYWAKVHQLTGTNLLSNYALTLLVIFYLQQVNIIPPVMALQKYNEIYCVDGWNTAINDSVVMEFKSDNNMDMFDIIGGFFKFYAHLNFEENIISIYTGKLIARSYFKSTETVPNEFDLYIHNINNETCQPLKIDTKICVQDPFEHNRNCTMVVSNNHALTLLAHFKLASETYEQNNKGYFIVDILYKKPPPIPTKKKNKKPNQTNKTPILMGRVYKPQKMKKGSFHRAAVARIQMMKAQKSENNRV